MFNRILLLSLVIFSQAFADFCTPQQSIWQPSTITQAGQYYLTSNIYGTLIIDGPVDKHFPKLVCINLNGYTLDACGAPYGIINKTGVPLFISNGTICNSSSAGYFVSRGNLLEVHNISFENNYVGIHIESNPKEFYPITSINDCSFNHTQHVGINIVSCEEVSIHNCAFNNGNAAITAIDTPKLLLQNISIEHNTLSQANNYLISLDQIPGCEIKDVTFAHNNINTNSVNNECVPALLSVQSSEVVTIKDITCNDNKGVQAFYGIASCACNEMTFCDITMFDTDCMSGLHHCALYIENNSNVNIQNIDITNQNMRQWHPESVTSGMTLSNVEHANVMNVRVDGVKNNGNKARGIQINGVHCSVENCHIKAIGSVSCADAVGFHCTLLKDNSVQNNTYHNVFIKDTVANTYARGMIAEQNKATLTNCTVHNIFKKDIKKHFEYGVDINNHYAGFSLGGFDVNIENCSILNDMPNSELLDPFVGYYIGEPFLDNSFMKDCSIRMCQKSPYLRQNVYWASNISNIHLIDFSIQDIPDYKDQK